MTAATPRGADERSSADTSYFERPERYLHRTYGVRIRAKVVRELLGVLNTQTVLDVGCGNGAVSLPLLGRNNRLTLVDASAAMVALATAAIPAEARDRVVVRQLKLVEAAASLAPHGVVLCMGVLAHVGDWRAAIGQLANLTAVHGRLVLQFTEARSLVSWMSRLRAGMAFRRYGYAVPQLTWADVTAEAARVGLRVQSWKRFSFVFPGMGRLPDAWLYQWENRIGQSILAQRWGGEYIVCFERVSG